MAKFNLSKFNLSAMVCVSAYTTVEAATLDEAIEIAEGREAKIDLYTRGKENFWIIDNADGMAQDIRHDE